VPYAEVEATNTKIAQAAGVDRRNMNEILRELRHALLIKPVEWDQKKMKAKGKKWVVYVLPVYSLALKDEEHGTYEVKNAEALDEVCRMIYEICRILSQEKSDSVPEDVGICRRKKSKKKSNRRSLSNTNIINNTINTKCGSTEIPQSESSLDPGDPGPLTSRSDAPVRSSETPVREEPCFDCSLAEPDGSGGMDCTVPGGLEKHDCCKRWREWNKGATNSEQIKERIITDWNKRDCQQCMYRDKDDGAEYCTMAFSDQGATIGKMEYCPMDREKIPF
jgi:hypothetical protein